MQRFLVKEKDKKKVWYVFPKDQRLFFDKDINVYKLGSQVLFEFDGFFLLYCMVLSLYFLAYWLK